MPELPLIPQPSASIQQTQITRPQPIAAREIAAGGEHIAGEAEYLNRINRWQQQDDYDQKASQAHAQLEAAYPDLMDAARQHNITDPQQVQAFVNKGLGDQISGLLKQFPDSSGKEALTGSLTSAASTLSMRSRREATVQRNQVLAEQRKVALNSAIVQAGFANSPDELQTASHNAFSLVDSSPLLSNDEKQAMHQQIIPKLEYSYLTGQAVRNPGQFLISASQPDVHSKFPNTSAEQLEKLQGVADQALALPGKQLDARVKMERTQLLTQMDQAILDGKPVDQLAQYGVDRGLLSQRDVRAHGIPGYTIETPVPADVEAALQARIDKSPKDWDAAAAYQNVPGTSKESAALRARLNAYAESRKKALEDPLQSTAIQMGENLDKEMFNPGYMGLSPERKKDEAAFHKLWDQQSKEAKSIDDLRKRAEHMRQLYAPKSVSGAALNTARLPGETDEMYYERLGAGLH